LFILISLHFPPPTFPTNPSTNATLAYPAVALTSHLHIDPLFPITSDLSGSSLQPSGPPPPPPGPYLHPSDGPDGLASAQDVCRITMLSQQRGLQEAPVLSSS
ncbi:Hypothetical predicted protein, partial [Scomber scombrus]